MNEKTKDVIVRALKTIIQGFLGALAITLPTVDLTDLAVLQSLLIGALAGGISAIMNLVLQYLESRK